MMMEAVCGECGAGIPNGTPDGHCTRCLFLLGLHPPDIADGAMTADLMPLLTRPHSPLGVKFHRLGNYELIEEIARGGMGVVFRAQQAGLNRPVALKFILGGRLASPALVRRFQVEAEAAAGLHHPNIVSVFEIGERDGHHFYSMELISGTGLDRRMNEMGLPPARTLTGESRSILRKRQEVIARLVAEVARAVDFAHQRGVLHRDLKPSNILIDEQGRPHLTDFGLAKLLDEDRTQFTQCDAMLGTPNYMAPELATGGAHHATTAADIYSLGAIIYELLTARPPFQAPTAVEVLRRAIGEDARHPRTLNPEIDPDLATISLRCLEKEPSKRYPSASALAEDLERWMVRKPIAARPVGIVERSIRWCRRNPALALLSLIAVLVTVAGFVGISTQWRRAERTSRDTHLHLYAADMGAAQHALSEGNFGRARQLLERYRPESGAEDPRGFEWRLLRHAAQGEHVAALINHSNIVNAVVFSPDGTWLATAGDDGRVNLWNMPQRRLARTLREHTNGVSGVAFSPDSGLLATAGPDGWIRLWDTATWQVTTQLSARPYLVAFSPVDPILAYSEGGSVNVAAGRVRLWRYTSGGRAGTWTNAGSRFAFSSDGRQLITGNFEQLSIWDIATGRRLRKTALPFSTLSLAVSPTAPQFAACSFQGEVRLFSLDNLEESIALKGHTGRPRSVAFSPDGALLASASGDQSIRIWKVDAANLTNGPPRTLRGHGNGVRCTAFSPDGRFLASGDKDGVVLLWDLWKQTDAVPVTNVYLSYTSAQPVFSLTGLLMAGVSSNQEISVWNSLTRERLRSIRGALIPLDISASPPLLTTLSSNYAWQVWNVDTGELRSETTFVEPAGAFTATLSPDGTFLVVGYHDGSFTVWRTRERSKYWQQSAHQSIVRAIAFSRDGRWLATASHDNSAKLWHLEEQREVAHLVGHTDLLFTIAFSPDGLTVATGSADHTTRLWNVPSGQSRSVLTGHREGIARLAFSPDGGTLATASDDDTVRLWHMATGRELVRLDHRGSVLSVAFAPNGELLMTGTSRRTLHFFRAPAFSELDHDTLQRTSANVIPPFGP